MPTGLTFERIAATCFAALIAGVGATYAALATLHLTLPATDLAHGQTMSRALSDPVTVPIALMCGVIGSAVGCSIAVPLLRNTDLSRALPVVVGVTILGGALVGPLNLLGIPALLTISVITMLLCRERWPEPAEKPGEGATTPIDGSARTTPESR